MHTKREAPGSLIREGRIGAGRVQRRSGAPWFVRPDFLGVLLTILLTFLSATGGLALPVNPDGFRGRARAVPIAFLPTDGRLSGEGVAYHAAAAAGTVFVTRGGVIGYAVNTPSGTTVITEQIAGNGHFVAGEEPLRTSVSLFTGKDPKGWRKGVSAYNAVSLGQVTKGVTVRLRAFSNNVEKLFTVEPGTDPEAIRIRVAGAESLWLNDDGELVMLTPQGPVGFTKPEAFQEIEGRRVAVPVAYRIDDPSSAYGFALGDFDRRHAVVIDPLLSSTFFGGSSYDDVWGMALDARGDVYITGATQSSDFPTTPGAHDQAIQCYKFFVSKLSGDLTTLLASTFLGPQGCHSDASIRSRIALDGQGNVFVAGQTSAEDFPITPGALRETCEAYFGPGYCYDGFVSKLNGDLTELLASTFIGGIEEDYINGLAIDGHGHVYITGSTYSEDFITTVGAYQRVMKGSREHSPGATASDAFIVKLTGDLRHVIASTYLGGTSWDWGVSLAFDQAGRVYLTGSTNSPDFPFTPSSYEPILTPGNCYDAFVGYIGCPDLFVARLSHDLSTLEASTLFGGTADEWASDIALTSSGDVVVAGSTVSTDFPTTEGVVGPIFHGGGEAYVVRFNGDLSGLLAATYLGGEQPDFAFAMALDGEDNVYVTGYTFSTDFPTTPDAHNPFLPVGVTAYAFVTRLSPDLLKVTASTVEGGSFPDNTMGRVLALDASGNVYVAGETWAADLPTTKKAYRRTFGGSHDVFLMKFDADLSAGQVLTVMTTGNGTGTVVPDSGSLVWEGNVGRGVYPDGTQVALNPVPGKGSRFAGWNGGGCSGSGPCAVVMAEETDVVASFVKPILSVAIENRGAVSSVPPGIACPPTCTAAFDEGTETTLSPTPLPGSVFAGWQGAGCSGAGECTIEMTSDTEVRAVFADCTYSLSPGAKSFPAAGQGLTATVRVTASGAEECPSPPLLVGAEWLSAATEKWKDNKGIVKVTAAPNVSAFARTGSVAIGGSAFGVTQAGVPCRVVSLAPAAQSFPPQGGEGAFAVSVSAPDCSWAVSSGAPWISLGPSGGSGAGVVSFAVGPMAAAERQRSSAITVASQGGGTAKKAFRVRQSR